MADSNWEWQHPYPSGTTVDCIQFIDNDNGWIAVGGVGLDHGAVYGTSNGGITWTRLCTTRYPLQRVFFLNTSEGWACGNNGILLHTTDGGDNWVESYPAGSTGLLSVEFIDSNYGTLTGWSGKIYRTMNGGASWSLQGSGISGPIFDVSFVSPATGWATASDGDILNTVTAGAFWQTQNTGTNADFMGVHFLNELKGFAVGDNYIVCTEDGGTNWFSAFQSGGAYFSDVDFNGMLGAASANLAVAVTENEGDSWEYESMPGHPLWPTEPNLKSISVPSSSRVFAAGYYGIIYSRDSSGDWNQLSNHETIEDVRGITHFGTNLVWACGDYGVIMRSTNGGQNWDFQTVNPGYSLRDINFPTALTGYCVGVTPAAEGVILKTVDGGSNWSQITPAGGIEGLLSVDFMNENCGVAVGAYGEIVFTTDGGSNWIGKTGFGTALMNRVRFSDTDRGWIVGTSGKIICFDFNSDSWSEQTSAMTHEFHGLFPLNSDTVWAVGWNGTIVRTVNAGGYWQTMAQTGNDYSDVWFAPNGLDGYLCGLYPSSFGVTSNGGATVTHTQYDPPENLLSDFTFVDVNNGWGCGTYGMILRFGDGSTGIANHDHAAVFNTVTHLTANPNPFVASSNVSVNLPVACNAVLDLFDLTGRKIQTLHSGNLSGGMHSFTVSGTDLAPGVYFLRLNGGGVSETRSVIRIP